MTGRARGETAVRLRLRFLVFVAGAVLMGFEILASRVLAPRYGSSVFVWGSLISTFLAALACGYYAGGRLADRRPDPDLLVVFLLLAGLLALAVIPRSSAILRAVAEWPLEETVQPLVASVIFFFLPAALLAAVTPFAVRLEARRIERVGGTAGAFSALSTVGSIAGTLAATFWLIPSYATRSNFILLSIMLAVAALALARRIWARLASAGTAAVLSAVLAFPPAPFSPPGIRILLNRDTSYYHLTVVDDGPYRRMQIDNLIQTVITPSDLDAPSRGYPDNLLLAFAFRPRIRRVCVIGLGGGVIPRLILRYAPQATVDAVEIDPAIVDAARRFFFLPKDPRLRIFVEDGRSFLARGGPPYDLIVVDAFTGTSVPFHLTTREFVEVVRHRLTLKGIYAFRVIGFLMGRKDRLFWASEATIRRQFGHVYLDGSVSPRHPYFQGSLNLFATVSDEPVPPETLRKNAEELARRWRRIYLPGWATSIRDDVLPPPGTRELTDAYAPVEALQHF
jgi:spermidine synthase